MRKILAAFGLAAALATPVGAWDLTSLNKTADQMNFDVAGHCSGTLIANNEKRLVLTAYHCIGDYVNRKSENTKDDDGFLRETPSGEPVVKKVTELEEVPIFQNFFDADDGDRHSVAYETTIVARNKDMDLAVLEIPAKIGPVPLVLQAEGSAKLSTRELTRGEDLWAIGNPLGLYGSVTKGILSSKQHLQELGLDEKDSPRYYVQYDGGLAPGNSGGGLFDTNGEYVGVNVMGVPGYAIGLAVPAEVVWELLEDNCLADAAGGTNPPKCGLKGTLPSSAGDGAK